MHDDRTATASYEDDDRFALTDLGRSSLGAVPLERPSVVAIATLARARRVRRRGVALLERLERRRVR